jgi:hypothetical protein
MTAKDKAKKLVDDFYQTTPYEHHFNPPVGVVNSEYKAWDQAKQCALIAVDEIMEAVGWGDMKPGVDRDNYWEEVKTEIANL